PPRALGAGEEDTAGRPRQLGKQPLLRRDPWDEHGLDRVFPERRPRPGPDRGHARPSTSPASGKLSRSVRAGDDYPVVALEFDRFRPGGLEVDQRATNDLVPELLHPPRRRLGLRGGPGG